MSIRQWLIAKVRDDAKHAELDQREQRTTEVADGLRQERIRNGFGEMFAVDGRLGSTTPRRRYP